MRSAMEQMNPDDTFMLIDFADKASTFHDSPLPNLPQHVNRAIAYLQALPASGGTNQLDGLERALKLPPDPRRLREVLLMTDGFIGNEQEIFAAAQRELGGARIFGFGVGGSVNHYLLSRLSQLGRGFYQYMRPDEDAEPAVERFVRRIERPVLTDVSIDWGGLEVSEVMPRAVPDLFDAQPIIVMGRYKAPGRATVSVSGLREGRRETARVTVELPAFDGAAPGLKQMWARAQIEELAREQYAGERSDIARQIQTLGLEYHLVTQYTSLVAADDGRVTNVPAQAVVVPTDGDVGGEPVQLGYQRQSTITPVKPPPPRHMAARPDPAASVNPTEFTTARGGDDEFAAAFGGHWGWDGKDDSTLKRQEVYIPPPPASAGGLRESLGHADIMEVIKANLPAIQACVAKQYEKEPRVSGKLVMKWTILTSGKTAQIEVVSDEYKSTYLATCMRGLIKGWTFPRTKTQGDPVVFPFKF
jgi:Ca-activated chloride channel family protein